MMAAVNSLWDSESDLSSYPVIAAECNEFFLCLPTSDVFSLESVSSLKKVASDQSPLLGVVQLESESFPIFALDHDMEFRAVDLQDHAILLFKAEGRNFGLICWDVKLTSVEEVNPQQVPRCMLLEHSVYTEAGVLNGMPACFISRKSLYKKLLDADLLVKDHPPTADGTFS